MPGRTIVVTIGLIATLFCSNCGRAGIPPGSASEARSASPPAVAQTSPSPCQTPATRGSAVLVYDNDRQNVVLFGGSGRDVYGDTWLWTNSCWRLASPASAPPPRTISAAAFDPNQHVLVIYGGQTPSGSWLDDTWTWDGSNWTQLQLTQHPALRFPMGAFDPTIGKFVVYGVLSDSSASQTWTWDGNWQQVSTGLAPAPRAASALAYDPSSHHVILFGGRSPNLIYLADTWAFDGTSWQQLTKTLAPPARQSHVMATVSAGVLLFGGEANFTRLTDTWIWNGTGWLEQATLHAPQGFGAIGLAGITSLNGQAFILSYGSLDGPAQTYLFSQGDWAAT